MPAQMRALDRGGRPAQHALIVLDREGEQVDQMLAGDIAGGIAHFVNKMSRETDHVNEQGADAAGGIQTQ